MFKLLKRTANTAIRLPFAIVWDVISLGNMGDGSSTVDILDEHQARKQLDDLEDALDYLRRIRK